MEKLVVFDACPECDLLLTKTQSDHGDKVCCPRCGYIIQKTRHQCVENTLVLSITGLILLAPANLLTLVGVKILGNSQDGSIWTGVFALYKEGSEIIAILVMLASIIFPIINLSLAFLVSWHVFKAKNNPLLTSWMRWYQHFNEWAMLEIYALGIIVACVKLGDLAELRFGLGLYAFISLLIINTLLISEFDDYLFWQRILKLRTENKS